MRQTPQTSNHKNQLNNSEKIKLLRLLRKKKLNNELQSALYQRGDQTTTDNGWAKYIEVTENGLYKQILEIPEENIRQQMNIRKILEPYDTILDLWPGWGRTVNYMHTKQLYRPIDVSAYVIDHIVKPHNISTEWTIGDWFNTRVFKESQWQKAYIIGKTIPNLSDDEIINLTNALTPTTNGKSTLVISYFPQFEETDDNISKLKAIYGDTNAQNPYSNKDSHDSVGNFVTGLLISLWFSPDTIELAVDYNKESHAIILKTIVKKTTIIDVDGEQFSWIVWEEIPLVQSRRMSDAYVAQLLAQTGRKRTEHKADQRIAVDIFEKKDPNKTPNLIKTRWQRLALILWFWAAIAAWYNTYEKHEKNTFLEQKQQKIQEELLLTYTKEQRDYFNHHIQESKSILKTFYWVQDEGYINGLIWPYMMSHPEFTDHIIQQQWIHENSPISTTIGEYIAMIIMKDQEKHSFLEYVGEDELWYKIFDAYIPDMLTTLQHYDSIKTKNENSEIKPEQELVISKSWATANGIWWLSTGANFIGRAITYTGTKQNIYTINDYLPWDERGEGKKRMLAVGEAWGVSNYYELCSFIDKYVSYKHQTKYLARQTSEYVNQKLRENNTELDYSEDINRIGIFEHLIKKFVLHGGNTKPYLTWQNIGQKVFDELIYTNPKCIQYFKEHILIDLETMTKLPWYERRRWRLVMMRWESSAYRNNPEYQEANRDFYKRD